MSGRSYDYKTQYHMSKRLANAFLSIRGCNLKPGDTIGLILPNVPEFGIATYAALEAGLKVTFANPLYTPGKYFKYKKKLVVLNINTLFIYIQLKSYDNFKWQM